MTSRRTSAWRKMNAEHCRHKSIWRVGLIGGPRCAWSRRRLAPAVCLLTLLIHGCKTESPPPRAEIQQQALENVQLTGPWKASPDAVGPIQDNWLATFNDPELDALVAEALQQNPD